MTDSEWGPVFPTVHPSSVLRARQADRALARSAFFQKHPCRSPGNLSISAARRRHFAAS
jgi:hypothetical protein